MVTLPAPSMVATFLLELDHLMLPCSVALLGVILGVKVLVLFLFIVLLLGRLFMRTLVTGVDELTTLTLMVLSLPF